MQNIVVWESRRVTSLSDQVVALSWDDLGHIRVPQHKVSIRPNCDVAFAGVQVEYLGCIRTGYCHKLVFIHLSCHLLRRKEKKCNSRLTKRFPKHCAQSQVVKFCKVLKLGHIKLTTHLSQIRDILSSVPLVPSGITVKLSLPTARWEVWKVQWALPDTCRSPLH